ncbi:MAG: glycogen synthase [Elusimicrobia bacterium]|nr:glycogen synthase [Elusimicrobiota bacterium]
MRILMASSEAVPFCKTGGLADVVGALSQVLSQKGHEIALFLPKYRSVGGGPHSLKPVGRPFWIPLGEKVEKAVLNHTRWGNVQVYFIEAPKYFDRQELYRTGAGDYEDNAERFIFFSRAVLEGAKLVGFKPDVIHVHDWQTALIPAYLKTLYRIDAFYVQTAALLTIHNIAYQGLFSKEVLFLTGFGWADFTPEKLEFFGKVNFLKAGLVYADLLTTVSPTYALEIQSSAEFGRGMEGVLRTRSKDLVGILNGIDVEGWNPESDSLLPVRYGIDNVEAGKKACKAKLREQCGLSSIGDIPLVGIVSRLDPQKGLDLVLEVFQGLVPPPAGETGSAPLGRSAGGGMVGAAVQLVVLGTGDTFLQQGFTRLSVSAPSQVYFRATFDEGFAHLIYAGSDLFLMPSRFEPCGLGQMIAMRYGTIPVVTRTGGLADTVADFSHGIKEANGFVSSKADMENLNTTLRAALSVYAQKPVWKQLVLNALGTDFSWEQSASMYVDLYQKAMQKA